ncbi:Hypothetical predicted protein, partial [Paramuricea clavata]
IHDQIQIEKQGTKDSSLRVPDVREIGRVRESTLSNGRIEYRTNRTAKKRCVKLKEPVLNYSAIKSAKSAPRLNSPSWVAILRSACLLANLQSLLRIRVVDECYDSIWLDSLLISGNLKQYVFDVKVEPVLQDISGKQLNEGDMGKECVRYHSRLTELILFCESNSGFKALINSWCSFSITGTSVSTSISLFKGQQIFSTYVVWVYFYEPKSPDFTADSAFPLACWQPFTPIWDLCTSSFICCRVPFGMTNRSPLKTRLSPPPVEMALRNHVVHT